MLVNLNFLFLCFKSAVLEPFVVLGKNRGPFDKAPLPKFLSMKIILIIVASFIMSAATSVHPEPLWDCLIAFDTPTEFVMYPRVVAAATQKEAELIFMTAVARDGYVVKTRRYYLVKPINSDWIIHK